MLKTILKSSGERYKRLREDGNSLVGTGADSRTSDIVGTTKENLDQDTKNNS